MVTRIENNLYILDNYWENIFIWTYHKKSWMCEAMNMLISCNDQFSNHVVHEKYMQYFCQFKKWINFKIQILNELYLKVKFTWRHNFHCLKRYRSLLPFIIFTFVKSVKDLEDDSQFFYIIYPILHKWYYKDACIIHTCMCIYIYVNL
jgi:hypothetical protein